MDIHLKCLVRCWVRFDFVVQCLSQYLVTGILFFYSHTFSLMDIHLKCLVRCWVRFDCDRMLITELSHRHNVVFFYFRTFSLMNIHLKRRVRCWVRFDFVVQCLSKYLVTGIIFFYSHTFSLMDIHLKCLVRSGFPQKFKNTIP